MHLARHIVHMYLANEVNFLLLEEEWVLEGFLINTNKQKYQTN